MPYSTNDTGSSSLCTTPACINIASEILLSLAPNYTEIDPCTDFDKYACNGWNARHEVSPGQDTAESLTDVTDKTLEQVKRIIEGQYPTGSEAGWITVELTQDQVKADRENFEKVQAAYGVCMNFTQQYILGLEPVVDVVKSVMDVFPVGKVFNNSGNTTCDVSGSMGNAIALFESLGITTLQTFVPSQIATDPNRMTLYIYPPGSSDIPQTKEGVVKYLKIASTLLAAVHPSNITVEQAMKLMTGVVEFQEKVGLALDAASAQSTSSSTPKLSIDEIQKIAPLLNYKSVVSKLAPPEYTAKDIEVSLPTYYQNVSDIVSKTPAEILQTFFIWRAVATVADYVESDLAAAYVSFGYLQRGADPKNRAPRWKRCVNLLDSGILWIIQNKNVADFVGPSGLTWILSRFFVDKHYSPKAKNLTTSLMDNLEATFIERLQTKSWISPEVKKAAVDKVNKIKEFIPFPLSPNATDPIALKAHYATVAVSNSHVANILSLAKASVTRRWDALGKPTDRNTFLRTTLEANAYYSPPTNKIAIFAGIQQFPLYDIGFPTYLTYGGMGSIVGHELTHGFDNKGRLYDATGNNTIWWDNNTTAEFTKRTQCFIEQYGKYTITAPNGTVIPVNGTFTLNENVADAGGVVNSFAAWKKSEEKEGKSPARLPGLDAFTPEQLFFLKWGQDWCAYVPPAGVLGQLANDHAPNAARIKVALQNSAYFKKAFNCPVKEPTCELW